MIMVWLWHFVYKSDMPITQVYRRREKKGLEGIREEAGGPKKQGLQCSSIFALKREKLPLILPFFAGFEGFV